MKIALIGTGLMGQPMAERILAGGHHLAVFNRTLEKTEALKFKGAKVARGAKTAVGFAEGVILMLADAEAIHQVLLAEDVRAELSGRTVIQMGTISPAQSLELNEKLLEIGADYLEAPVLGSVPEATAGRLIVMVGASPNQFARWVSILKCFGPEPMLIGPVGEASALKLALNQLIASLMAGFSLSLAFVQQKGIDTDLFMKILRKSALYAPSFDKKLRRMTERDYSDPNFPMKHLVKDVDLFLEEAESVNLQTAGLEGIHRLLKMAFAKGLIDTDYSALFDTINPG